MHIEEKKKERKTPNALYLHCICHFQNILPFSPHLKPFILEKLHLNILFFLYQQLY